MLRATGWTVRAIVWMLRATGWTLRAKVWTSGDERSGTQEAVGDTRSKKGKEMWMLRATGWTIRAIVRMGRERERRCHRRSRRVCGSRAFFFGPASNANVGEESKARKLSGG
eukprot:3698436-Pyramimonas_sp.AAC.1